MNREFESRVERLEEHLGTNAVATLHLDGGVVHRISGSARHYFELMNQADAQRAAQLAGESMPVSDLDEELDWIRSAHAIDEDGHLIELLQVQLHGPVARGVVNQE
ncbi:MAG: hypothetical protein WCE63_04980 [Acidobacteriaceae bacterium]